MSASAADY